MEIRRTADSGPPSLGRISELGASDLSMGASSGRDSTPVSSTIRYPHLATAPQVQHALVVTGADPESTRKSHALLGAAVRAQVRIRRSATKGGVSSER
jgi:hypothetical protein